VSGCNCKISPKGEVPDQVENAFHGWYASVCFAEDSHIFVTEMVTA